MILYRAHYAVQGTRQFDQVALLREQYRAGNQLPDHVEIFDIPHHFRAYDDRDAQSMAAAHLRTVSTGAGVVSATLDKIVRA